MSVLYNSTILLIDDEVEVLESFSLILNSGGYNDIVTCSDSLHIMPMLQNNSHINLILLDLIMPNVKGTELLQSIRESYPSIPILVITALDDLRTAVNCIKSGAFDYLVKPVENMRLLSVVRHALERLEMTRENQELKKQLLNESLFNPDTFGEIITRSKGMLSIFKYIEAIGPSPEPVLITGETGTGKELIARAIHRASGRRGRFVAVNIAGLDDTQFSDTLFGHRKGAFTGAVTRREGLINQAACGTLFLDEIGDLEPVSQIKLLRLLQENEFYPLGTDLPHKADVRILAATNLQIEDPRVVSGFRRDLFYRLQTHHVELPALRKRKEDLPLLVAHFFQTAAKRLGRDTPRYPEEIFSVLNCYDFPGNIRELEGMIFDAVSNNTKMIVSLEDFKNKVFGKNPSRLNDAAYTAISIFESMKVVPTLYQARESLVSEAMKRAQGNQTVAARMLGISQPALSKWLKSQA
ncbi:MAG: sigma-54 dependent transcriptional regulator [Desulforhopalus sp.]